MKVYKQLVLQESHDIKHKYEEEKLRESYVRRLRFILKTRNKMQTTE